MKTWHTAFLRIAGVATGVTIGLCATLLVMNWYLNRPKAWNSKAISCVSSRARPFFITQEGQVSKVGGFTLKFALANNTGKDYHLFPSNLRLFARQAATGALEEFNGTMDASLLIPDGERAQLVIYVHYICTESSKESQRDEATCFQDAFGDVSGFVALDNDVRFRIDLPKPTLERSKDDNKRTGAILERLRPDRGDMFSRRAACERADDFLAACRKNGVRPQLGSPSPNSKDVEHLPEWGDPPVTVTSGSCEIALKWEDFCRESRSSN